MKVESVKVAAARRSGGIGARMMAAAEEEAQRRGAGLIELTSNATRTDAHRFYRRLGYDQSHIGFKKRP
jgi:GNAT superfamily N-acetyltransferase